MPIVTLRSATLEDLDALLALEATFPGDRLSRRSVRHLLRAANGAVLVAEDGGKVVGDAVTLFRRGSSRARLYSLVVAPEARSMGVGARLLEGLEAQARSRGCREMRLEVREDNAAALALYERHGYRRVGRREDYYEDGTAALRMLKKLGDGRTAKTFGCSSLRAL